MSTAEKLTNGGGLNMDKFLKIAQLEHVNNLMGDIRGKLLSLGNAAETAGIQNKEFWSSQKKEAEEALEKMDKAEKGGATWNAQLKKLNEANANLKTWDFSSKGGSKKDEAAQLKIAANNREKTEQDYAEKLKTQAKKNEFDIAQAGIDGLKEGLDKQLAQIDLNYKELEFENKQRKAEMLKELQDIREMQWNEENPKEKEKGQTFDRSTVTGKDLSKEQLAQIKEYEDVAKKYRVHANKLALEDALADVLTYEQQREKIAKEFADKRKELISPDGTLREGVTQGNIEELNISEKDAYIAIDDEFASREEMYEAWMNKIAEMTLEQLTYTLEQAEAELKKLEGTGATGGDVALARTKVNAAKEKITKGKADMEVSPGKKELKDWKELQNAIGDADSSLGDIEDTLEGTAKDIIKTARQIGQSATKMIDGIITLANMAIAGAQTTAVGATAAIATVEKASVILTIISAALMIVTQMFSLFSKKDVMAEFNKELANLNDELAKAKLNARIGNDDRESIFGTDSWMRAIDNINAATDALSKYNDTLNGIKNRKRYDWIPDDIAKQMNADNRFENVNESIKNMQMKVQHATWFRNAKYKSLGEVSELFKDDGSVDIKQLREFIDSDMFGKLSQENQAYLKDMVDYWESYENAVSEVKDYLADIFGDLGATMTDALVDAFANGTDAAKAFTASVSEMLEKLAKQIVYTVTIAPLAEKAQKDVLAIMKDTGLTDEEKFNKMTGVIDEFVDGAIDAQQTANDLLGRIQQSAKEKGYDLFNPEEDRKAVAKGIQAMSQDSAYELNGRFAVIQYMTNSIDNNVKMLTESSSQSLRHLAGIEANTGRLEAIEKNIVSINGTLGDIQMKGLKIV